jgi:hypothetical protein
MKQQHETCRVCGDANYTVAALIYADGTDLTCGACEVWAALREAEAILKARKGTI